VKEFKLNFKFTHSKLTQYLQLPLPNFRFPIPEKEWETNLKIEWEVIPSDR